MEAMNIMNVRKVDLDNVLDQFGIFKRHHVQLITLIFISLLFNGMYSMNYVFAVEEVSYRCKDDFADDYCKQSNSTHLCLEWVYDDPDSFFAYFQLACQEWKRTLVGTVHSIGYMCGLLIIGPMSDRFGRKPIAVLTGVLGAIFGTLRSFSPWYWFYIIMEFLEGAIGDNCSPLFILTLETTSVRNKLIAFMLTNIGYVFGGVTLAFVAWLTPDWRWFLRALYLPGFIFLTYKYFLDESPRWLLTKGRKEKAITIINNAAKRNKFDIDKNSLEHLSCEVEKEVPFAELLKQTFMSN